MTSCRKFNLYLSKKQGGAIMEEIMRKTCVLDWRYGKRSKVLVRHLACASKKKTC